MPQTMTRMGTMRSGGATVVLSAEDMLNDSWTKMRRLLRASVEAITYKIQL
jgi:hypothetical protein